MVLDTNYRCCFSCRLRLSVLHNNGQYSHRHPLQYVDCVLPLAWTVWPSAPPADIPFPKSADLLDYEFVYGGNAVPPGIGADTWYPSWGADGRLYSSWTDGNVNGYPSGSSGHGATTGMAIVTGDNPFNLTVEVPRPSWPAPADPYEVRARMD